MVNVVTQLILQVSFIALILQVGKNKTNFKGAVENVPQPASVSLPQTAFAAFLLHMWQHFQCLRWKDLCDDNIYNSDSTQFSAKYLHCQLLAVCWFGNSYSLSSSPSEKTALSYEFYYRNTLQLNFAKLWIPDNLYWLIFMLIARMFI